jgi:Tat protein translocase TatB subunit
MEFLGIGLPELVLILVLTLIVVGPQRLPETAAQIGRAIREFRRYSSGMTSELKQAIADLEKEYEELRGELKAASAELRDKAQAIGNDLTSVSDEARENLRLEEPKASGSKEATAEPPSTSTIDDAQTSDSVAAT